MALKAVVDKLDSVPEAARDLYAEKDGKFYLSVEGMVEKSRLDEFRNNNVALKRQLDETTAKFEGIDPEAARTLLSTAEKERQKKLIDAGKVEELLTERVTAMRVENDKALKALAAERDGLNTQLGELVIDNAIRASAATLGVRPEAVEDVLLRGKRVFKLDGNRAVAMDGDKPLYGASGDPLGVNEWVKSLTASAAHLFTPSTGGGARSGGGGGGIGIGSGRVSKNDSKGFLANLEKIAKGEVIVGA